MEMQAEAERRKRAQVLESEGKAFIFLGWFRWYFLFFLGKKG
jgi:hypothetical protein